MKVIIPPFRYNAIFQIPASKSYLQRAIAVSCMSRETFTIHNFYPSHDAMAALKIAAALGKKIIQKGASIDIIDCPLSCDSVSIHCGESALACRMFSIVASSIFRQVTVTGENTLLSRRLLENNNFLLPLGITITSSMGRLPFHIRGRLFPGEVVISNPYTSQWITGLLITLPFLEGNSAVRVERMVSRPYVYMTIALLEKLGIQIEMPEEGIFIIPGYQRLQQYSYTAEGDWSAAAVHLVGAAISGRALLKGLCYDSLQADREIIQLLKQVGARVEQKEEGIEVKKQALHSFYYDATHTPDLFPVLAVLATQCEGESVINGVSRLSEKESHRAYSIQEEFSKLGADICIEGDYMRIKPSFIKGGTISSRGDHRIAMAGALLASVASGEVTIEGAESVSKSYPDFFEDLSKFTSIIVLE